MCGSADIYSNEYICTQVEIDVTTTNITTVNVSNWNPQLKDNISTSNQRNNSIYTGLPNKATS